MMYRKLLAWLLVVASGVVAAVDLGPMEVKSAIGAPLEVVIPITTTRRERARGITVQFFDYRDASKSMDVSQILALEPVSATVRHKAGRRDFELVLTSDNPVREVRVAFGVQVTDSRGNTISRRYISILPGSFRPNTDGATRQNILTDRELRSVRNHGFVHGAAAPGDTVSSADFSSLWDVSMQVRAGYGISVYQTMMAIHGTNPEAFRDNNVNMMLAGYELAIPTVAAISNYDRATAIRSVAHMNYVANVGPIDTVAIRDILQLVPPDAPVAVVSPVQEPVPDLSIIPWEPPADTVIGGAPLEDGQDAVLSGPEQPPLAAVPAPTVDAPALLPSPAVEDAESSNAVLFGVGLFVALLLAIVFFWMRRRATPAAVDTRVFATEQLDLVEAHLRMGRSVQAQEQLTAVLERGDLTPEERARAEELRASRGSSDAS